MRKRTIKSGLNLILAGVVSITLATFYHSHFARMLLLSNGEEAVFILAGLFSGGAVAFAGILLTLTGMLRKPGDGREVRLCYTLVLLASALIIFFFLFFHSDTDSKQPGIMPGETITI